MPPVVSVARGLTSAWSLGDKESATKPRTLTLHPQRPRFLRGCRSASWQKQLARRGSAASVVEASAVADKASVPAAGSVPIQGLTPHKLLELMPSTATLEEARKVVSAAYNRNHLLQPPIRIDGVRRASAHSLHNKIHVGALKVVAHHPSRVDPFEKWLFEMHDGLQIETVRIPLEKQGRFSVCVSSQGGCAQGCTYCATGKLGLLRDLAAWEIVEQVRVVQRELRTSRLPAAGPGAAGDSVRPQELQRLRNARGRVHGVVFQGMGEPMANLEAVLEAIGVLADPGAGAVSMDAMTLSTVGSHPEGIRRLAREAPKVRLALSVGAARPEVRKRMMPIEKAHPLRSHVMDAAVYHARTTGLRPMWAVTPLLGVNDSVEDAEALAELALEFTARTDGIRPRISLVPYNSIGESDPYQRVPGDKEAAFRDAMRDLGVFSHKRYSGGDDVGAACGQLAASNKPQEEVAAHSRNNNGNWAGTWTAQ